ncbi:MAG TPA: GlsB/YeaQ/YmgE family stress response membrane protein [Candidatus Saccharimonadales bacterium]|jgi:uncharacterized membrane protein YeaQ/YmgE (transglycosylase-associated protein family)|nr:GlsB/YeaQ/YmgE family stress response membrane protein [Candidatus Saccharimonadales bacterium]
MNWIGWVILGGLAGWVASMLMKEEGGLLKNILVGIIGGVVGGGIVELMGGSGVNGFNLYSFIVAVLGAVVLLWIVRMIKR